jgi:hypothetical protein
MIPSPIDKELQKSRQENYCRHFECRQQILAMGLDERVRYVQAAEKAPKAILNKYGSDDRTQGDWLKVFDLAIRHKLNPRMVNAWYVSQEGWEEFQSEWLKVDTYESYRCGQPVDK